MTGQPATIRNTVVHRLFAAAIEQEYLVSVQLPYHYHESDKRYPVLYLLDGDQFFGTVTDTVRLLQHAKELPDLIIVGIGYGTDTSEHFVERMRDYAPSPVEQFPYAGGAALFLRFVTDEVVPLINTHYRTDNTNNTLVGASISGLFALYAMLHQPSPFHHFLVSSPALHWDGFLIRQLARQYAQQATDLPATLFLSVGGLEDMVADLYAFADTLRGWRLLQLTVYAVTLAEETHFSVQPAAFCRGLRMIFQQST